MVDRRGQLMPYKIVSAASWRDKKYRVKSETTGNEETVSEALVSPAEGVIAQNQPETALVYDETVEERSWMSSGGAGRLRDPVNDARKLKGALGVTSVADMVEKLKATNRAPFTYITISGHGDPGGMNVGSADSGKYVEGKAIEKGKLEHIANELTELAKLMTDDGVLYLAGCEVGSNFDETHMNKTKFGDKLLKELSRLLPGITVAAMIENASPRYDEESDTLFIGWARGLNTFERSDVVERGHINAKREVEGKIKIAKLRPDDIEALSKFKARS